MAFGTVYCLQEICIPGEKTGNEGNTVEAFSRCTLELPPGSDHGLGPEIGLLRTLQSRWLRLSLGVPSSASL